MALNQLSAQSLNCKLDWQMLFLIDLDVFILFYILTNLTSESDYKNLDVFILFYRLTNLTSESDLMRPNAIDSSGGKITQQKIWNSTFLKSHDIDNYFNIEFCLIESISRFNPNRRLMEQIWQLGKIQLWKIHYWESTIWKNTVTVTTK